MEKTIHVALETLTGTPPSREAHPEVRAKPHPSSRPLRTSQRDAGTFFLETFGCQMNDHDSEKVAGVLVSRGYTQVQTPADASVILYNTCSIREKAAQK